MWHLLATCVNLCACVKILSWANPPSCPSFVSSPRKHNTSVIRLLMGQDSGDRALYSKVLVGAKDFCMARLRPDVQPFTLSNTILGSRSGPFHVSPVKIHPFHSDRMLSWDPERNFEILKCDCSEAEFHVFAPLWITNVILHHSPLLVFWWPF